MIVASAVVYVAKGLLMPLAMAAVLAVMFSPIARRLEKYRSSIERSSGGLGNYRRVSCDRLLPDCRISIRRGRGGRLLKQYRG